MSLIDMDSLPGAISISGYFTCSAFRVLGFVYRGTWLIKKRNPPGPPQSPRHRATVGSYGGG